MIPWASFMNFEELIQNIDAQNDAVRKQLVNNLLSIEDKEAD